MESLSDRLNQEEDFPQLREPNDLDNPGPDYAPFKLEEARPLSQSLGDHLTDPTWAGDDANPDVVLEHSQNAELTAWISRYRCGDGFAYVLTCWDFDFQLHYDIPKQTVTDIIEQASSSPYWTFDIPDDELLEKFIDEL